MNLKSGSLLVYDYQGRNPITGHDNQFWLSVSYMYPYWYILIYLMTKLIIVNAAICTHCNNNDVYSLPILSTKLWYIMSSVNFLCSIFIYTIYKVFCTTLFTVIANYCYLHHNIYFINLRTDAFYVMSAGHVHFTNFPSISAAYSNISDII